jgi:hypothetical protein
MTNEQVREILQLYRPGTADTLDPAFAEALEFCKHNAELKSWFESHCALYSALRSKFKQISVPEGLKEQIIAERRVHTTPVWQRVVLAAGAVAVAVMVLLQIQSHRRPEEPHDFTAYRAYMGGMAVRGYGMDTNLSDLDAIRTYLAQRRAIADYVLPPELRKNAKPAGCLVTSWEGKDVSMICFQSGRPLAPGKESDLWLFITQRTVAKDAPAASTPKFEKVNGLMTASWNVGNRTYVLAAQADQQFLGKFVPEKAVL